MLLAGVAVAAVLGEQPVLRRHLADSAAPEQIRRDMVKALFGGKVSDITLATLGDVVSSRWSRPLDLIDGIDELAWQALLAGEPARALGACDKSLALQPGDLIAEINRAYALMYAGRVQEARAIHVAHKYDVFADGNKPWSQAVAEDFDELRKAGQAHPQMTEIEAAFGSTPKRLE